MASPHRPQPPTGPWRGDQRTTRIAGGRSLPPKAAPPAAGREDRAEAGGFAARPEHGRLGSEPLAASRFSSRPLAGLLVAALAVAGACGAGGEDDAGPTDTTPNQGTVAGGDEGAPTQGDPRGANTGAGGGQGGGADTAIDPGGANR
ncbi:MAG: hypothetical protein ACLGIO_13045 [Acidimicrobiia bacterium]